MTQINYYFSTLSPFSYLAGNRLENVAAKHEVSIEYKPVDILGLFSRTGGKPPKERHPSRNELRAQELQRQSTKLGMPLNLQPAHWPTNAAPSSYAIIAAQKAGGGDIGKLAQSFLRACWAEEKDIAQDDVVRACLTAAGFDASLADSGLLVGAETYARNLDDAVASGVFGAPFYVLEDGTRFWGQDRIEDIDLYLSGKL